ncbi:MAG: hypothetical protein K9J79_03965 [Desulfobacteraceae bacterium]|nr:hypothetical protein [Desulfobacteraceae bacterium]
MKKLKFFIGFFSLVVLISTPSFLLASEQDSSNTPVILEYFQQWMESGHANPVLPNEINEGAIKLPEDAKCLICHDGKGFINWYYHDFSKEFETPEIHEAGGAYPNGCMTCHTQDNPDKCGTMLRVSGDTPPLLAGYTVENAGSGAICMVCHNSRRGLYDDKNKPEMNHRAPHEASNVDMLLGRNIYFVPIGEIKPHSMIKETCASCHIDSWAGGGGHTFEASWEGCMTCHADVDPDEVKTNAVKAREDLKEAIDKAVFQAIQAAIDAGDFQYRGTDFETEQRAESYTKVESGRVEEVETIYFHGGQAYYVTIDGEKLLISIRDLKMTGKDFLKTSQGQIVAKAGWNLNVIDHDRSKGAHNPSMLMMMVRKSVEKLDALDFSQF